MIFISAFLSRFGPQLALVGALGVSGYVVGHHIYDRGVSDEKAARAVIDNKVNTALQAALEKADAKIAALQGDLNKTVGNVAAKQTEVDHAKASSAVLQSQLADGSRRMSILTRVATAQAAAIESGQGAGAAPVDQGRAVSQTLDGRVAGDLEWLRQTRDTALDALSGCIGSYDAVKKAQDGAAP